MGKTKRQGAEKRRRGRPPKRTMKPLSPPGSPDELAIAVLTTTPKELKDWERRQTKRQ